MTSTIPEDTVFAEFDEFDGIGPGTVVRPSLSPSLHPSPPPPAPAPAASRIDHVPRTFRL